MVIHSLEQVQQTESPNSTAPIFPSQLSHKRGIKKRSFGLLILLFLLSGVSYLAYRQASAQRQGPPGIAVVPLERTTFSITVSANGFVQPEQSINVSPKTAGIMIGLLASSSYGCLQLPRTVTTGKGTTCRS
jgi:HlyD family secretion protein